MPLGSTIHVSGTCATPKSTETPPSGSTITGQSPPLSSKNICTDAGVPRLMIV
jgi:hypothetical protein